MVPSVRLTAPSSISAMPRSSSWCPKRSLNNTGNQDLQIIKSALSPMVSVFSLNAPPMEPRSQPVAASFTINCIPSMVGLATARLDITTDDPATPGGTKFSVPLSVNGVVANVTVDPLVLDFTTPIYVGQKSEMKSFKVQPGSRDRRQPGGEAVGRWRRGLHGRDRLQDQDPAGESSEIGLTFDPRTAKAEIKAVAVVEADGVQVPMNVQLKGTSMSPLLTVSPTTLRFRGVFVGEQSQSMPITIANDGNSPLEIDVIADR